MSSARAASSCPTSMTSAARWNPSCGRCCAAPRSGSVGADSPGKRDRIGCVHSLTRRTPGCNPAVEPTAPARRRVCGVFTAEVGQEPESTLKQGLTAGLGYGPAPAPTPAFKPGDMAGAMRGTQQGRWPSSGLHILGTARDRRTSQRARREQFRRPGAPPRYVAPLAVLGAHVTLEQLYSTVRFRLDHPYWMSHLSDNESSVVEDDRSTLSVEASEEGNWLVYTSSTPATLSQLEIRAISSCLALAQLALLPEADHDLCHPRDAGAH